MKQPRMAAVLGTLLDVPALTFAADDAAHRWSKAAIYVDQAAFDADEARWKSRVRRSTGSTPSYF